MTSPSQFPVDRRPARLDRRILHRSVIAIPLREAIDAELAMTEALEAQYAEYLGGATPGSSSAPASG